MEPSIRPARDEDSDDIAAFSTGTFEWGDYVPEELPGWLDDDHSVVIVATDADDRAVAVSRAVMLSEREAWVHATRVHPHHRRQGIADALNRHGCEWARDQGAVVARLMVEDWNEPARGQVLKSGYRRVSRWVAADLDISMAVIPATNGGRRVPSEERLTPGRSTEVDLAWMSWVNGEIARAGRELIPRNWLFRRARPSDLAEAALSRSLWHSASGWIIGSLDEETLDVSWVSTSDLDVRRLVKAVIDLAEGVRAEQVHMLVPRTVWLVSELERSGFTLTPSSIFERSL